jgi:GTP cyclohydrolase I
VPEDKILGLSKLARVVEVFARRLQVQERLTKEIAESISELVGARAVSVIVEASHMCMAMRGVSKPGSMTRTEFNLGVENLNELDRSRFMKGMDS